MSDRPAGSQSLHEIDDIRAEWLAEDGYTVADTLILMAGTSFAVLLAFASARYGRFGAAAPVLVFTVSLLPAIHLFWKRSQKRREFKRRMLKSIAVDSGHPWHPDPVGESSDVHLMTVDGVWHTPEPEQRFAAQRDPMLAAMRLVPAIDEGPPLGLLDEEWTDRQVSRWLELLNMTMLLGDAQQRQGEDPFDAGREREESAEGFLERQWLDTTPGQLDVELGQLANAKDILARRKRRSEEDGDPGEEQGGE